MSEITKEEIEDGLALLKGESVEIEPPRKKIVRRGKRMVEVEESAYVKFSTEFKSELKNLNEFSLKVLIYIGLSIGFETGSAFPGVRKIAEETGMDKDTVTKAVEDLEEKGYLEVFRRQGNSNVYTPTRYFSIGESVPSGRTVEELSLENTELSLQNAKVSLDSTVNLHNQINKNQQEGVENQNSSSAKLTPEEYDEANAKVDVILALNKGQALTWKGREFFLDSHLPYADWWNNKTNLTCGKKNVRSWRKAFSEWKDEGLLLSDLQESYAMDIGWKKLFTDPNELTKKAVAIKAARLHSEKRVQADDADRDDLDANGIPLSY